VLRLSAIAHDFDLVFHEPLWTSCFRRMWTVTLNTWQN